MRTIVETALFVKSGDALMGDKYLTELIVELAANPRAGDLIEKTGGFRKIRGKRVGSGKRGGVRVYYFPCHSLERPIYMIACLAKADDKPFSAKQKKALKDLAQEFKAANVVQFAGERRS